MRLLLTAVLLLPAAASAQTHYLEVTNTSAETLVGIATAAPDSGRFLPIPIGEAGVRGGGGATTVALDRADGGCVRDLRLQFANGRVVLHPRLDVCRTVRYRTGRLAPLDAPARTAVARSDSH